MKKMQILIAMVIAVISMSCTSDYSTIADRLFIDAGLNGKVLVDGDTILIDQIQTDQSFIGVNYQIHGLSTDESVEVYQKIGYNNQSMMPVGESYSLFTKQNNSFVFGLAIDDFANIWQKEQMFTTLKFKCSDGSEKWLSYPVKLIVDSSEYKPTLEVKLNYQTIPSQVILNKGEGIYVTVWMDMKMYVQTYLRVVSDTYINDVWTSSGGLPGYDEKLTGGNTKEVYIPYEHDLTKRVLEFQVIGRYGSSEIQKVTILWQ